MVEERDRTMSAYFEEVSMNVCQYELEYLKREANKKDSTIIGHKLTKSEVWRNN